MYVHIPPTSLTTAIPNVLQMCSLHALSCVSNATQHVYGPNPALTTLLPTPQTRRPPHFCRLQPLVTKKPPQNDLKTPFSVSPSKGKNNPQLRPLKLSTARLVHRPTGGVGPQPFPPSPCSIQKSLGLPNNHWAVILQIWKPGWSVDKGGGVLFFFASKFCVLVVRGGWTRVG